MPDKQRDCVLASIPRLCKSVKNQVSDFLLQPKRVFAEESNKWPTSEYRVYRPLMSVQRVPFQSLNNAQKSEFHFPTWAIYLNNHINLTEIRIFTSH